MPELELKVRQRIDKLVEKGEIANLDELTVEQGRHYSEDQIKQFGNIWATRFTDMELSKSVLEPGETTQLTGKLESNVWWSWGPATNQTVKLMVGETPVSTDETDSEGRFRFVYKAPSYETTIYLKVYFDGTWNLSPEMSDKFLVEVRSPENGEDGKNGEKEPPFWKTREGKIAIIGGSFLATAVVVSQVGGD